MVFVPFHHSLRSAPSGHCLDMAVKSCHMCCVNRWGKCVFRGAHMPQPTGPTNYGMWWNASLHVLVKRYFSTISSVIQNLFLHASKLGATCWGRLVQSFSNGRIQTFLLLAWRRMEQGFMFANTTPHLKLCLKIEIFLQNNYWIVLIFVFLISEPLGYGWFKFFCFRCEYECWILSY